MRRLIQMKKWLVISVTVILLTISVALISANQAYAQEPEPPLPELTQPVTVTTGTEITITVTVDSIGNVLFHSPQTINGVSTILTSVTNGDCDVNPVELKFVGLPRPLQINESAIDIAVVVDGDRICWWVVGNWPGTSSGAQASFYVDSLVKRVGNGQILYDPPDYVWQGVPNYPNGLPPYTHDEWKVIGNQTYEQFEIRVYAYERQVIPGKPANEWPGLAVDASAYPKNPNFYLFFPIVSGQRPPVCQLSCTGWGIRQQYRTLDRITQLAQSLNGALFAHLGWTNVYAPNTVRFAFTYNGVETPPPATGLFEKLYENRGNGYVLVKDYASGAGADGNWQVGCADLGYNLNPHKQTGGFYIEEPGCGRIYCQFDAYMKDPPPAQPLISSQNGVLLISLAALMLMLLFGCAKLQNRQT